MLSPCLSNILLTDWDRELERRGLAFCRYADDCNIYVRSETAGRRVLARMTAFLKDRLKLRVNEAKSACGRPWERKFLGYTFTRSGGKTRLRFARESEARLRTRVRDLTREGRGRRLDHVIETLNPVLRGWANYFRLSESKQAWTTLDGWVRRRLRCLIWRQAKTRDRRTHLLRNAGLDEARAWHSGHNGQGPWWNSGAQHMNQAYPKAFFNQKGLLAMASTVQAFQRHS